MILHLSRMRRNVTRIVYDARENVSATTLKNDPPGDVTGSRYLYIPLTDADSERFAQDLCAGDLVGDPRHLTHVGALVHGQRREQRDLADQVRLQSALVR